MVDDLLRGYGAFRESYVGDEHEFLASLAGQKQAPGALYVGCSDSRVVPELLTTAAPGQLFVVRNVANLVPELAHADASVGAALEYAVGYLHVPHIIVCGHYGCGGVRATLDGLEAVRKHASLYEWLAGVVPAAERARAIGLDGEALWRRAVEENVLLQLDNLWSFPEVEEAVRAGRLQMHGWVYDLYSLRLSVYDKAAGGFRPAEDVLGSTGPIGG